jgi:type IV pilus assembly protein PilW
MARRWSKGITIVDLLIGVAIGLFILAGASAMFVNNVTNSRRLLIETRINQDLRSTMDLISRDLRRGAYWGNSLAGTLATGSTSTTQPNPYANVTLTGSTQVDYTYTRDTVENNTLDASSEQFGFKLDTATNAIQMNIGGTWQALTNTDILTITAFAITPTETTIDVRAACAKTCTDTVLAPTCPRIQVRSYNLLLTGTSKTDTAVSRTLQSQVRVRNDVLLGSCPA